MGKDAEFVGVTNTGAHDTLLYVRLVFVLVSPSEEKWAASPFESGHGKH